MRILRKILNKSIMKQFKVTAVSVCAIVCAMHLVLSNAKTTDFSNQQIDSIIKQTIPKNELNISASHEVVVEINHLLHSISSLDDLRNAIKRMNEVKNIIALTLQTNNIPEDLMVLPIVESEYKQSEGGSGSASPAGIWQMVPETARKYGLIIKGKRDDRLNIKLETIAISKYLNDLYSQFHDWRLVIIAYKLGDAETMKLINKVKSHDPLVLMQSSSVPSDLKKYLMKIECIIIIMHNPSLIGIK